jgi:hypothetical protein
LVIIFVALTGTLAWVEESTVRGFVNEANTYLNEGGATWILQSPQAISGNACDALSTVEGVLASGSLRDDHSGLTDVLLPRTTIPLYSVTPGFFLVVNANHGFDPGLVVSDQVFDRYGLAVEGRIHTTRGEVPISGMYRYPEDGRRSGLGFAALQVVTSDEIFDECWVTMWPTIEQTKSLLYLSLIPHYASRQTQIFQLNPQHASVYDVGRYDHRLTRWTPLISLVISLILAVTTVWTRRLEHASNLHAGVSHFFLHLQLLFESISWVAIATIFCIPIVIVTSWGSLSDTICVMFTGVRVLVSAVSGAIMGTVIGCSLIRESQLFTFFKYR